MFQVHLWDSQTHEKLWSSDPIDQVTMYTLKEVLDEGGDTFCTVEKYIKEMPLLIDGGEQGEEVV